jgi:hypothetical protein
MMANSTAAAIHAPIATALGGLATVADIGGYESPIRVTSQREPRRSRYSVSAYGGRSRSVTMASASAPNRARR